MDNYSNNYKYNIIGSLLCALVGSSAAYLAAYLKSVGGTDFHFAMLNSFPSVIAMICLIPGAILIDSAKNKLNITLMINFLSRLFFLFYAFIPFLPKDIQPMALVLLMGVRNAPEAVWCIGYQTIMADAFPANKLNEAIGNKNRYSYIVTMAWTFICGIFLSLNEKYPVSNITLYQILFLFTFMVGILEVNTYKKLMLINSENTNKTDYISSLKYVIKSIPHQKKYLTYCVTVIVFYLGWQMSWPLYNIYQLDVLNANSAWIGYINITSAISQIITIGIWIKLVDKIGTKKVLAIGMFLMSLSPCVYALSKTLFMLLVMQLIVGSGMSAVNTLLFNELIYVCPEKNRTLYISLFTCLTQVTSSFMPFIGIWAKEVFSIYTALYISGGLRLIGSIIFLIFNSRDNNGAVHDR